MRMWRRMMVVLTAAILLFNVGYGQGVHSEEEDPGAEDIPELAPLYGTHDLYGSSQTTVIVELKEKSILQAKQQEIKQTKEDLQAMRGELFQKLEERIEGVQIIAEYDHVFSGFAVQLASHDIPQLLSMSGIKAVYPDLTYTVADEHTESLEKVLGENRESRTKTRSSVPYIQAKAVHDEHGYTGKGVRIGILDTGVDYTHYDLEHAFGENKGWDAIDMDADPQETRRGNPSGEATTHGTHVAGIIAGDGVMQGVAPGADLFAYRVLGPDAEGQTSHLLQGIERAVLDEVDVLNLSVQSEEKSYDWAVDKALDQVVQDGIVVVGASGNLGPTHETVSGLGASSSPMIVGASQMPYRIFDVHLHAQGGSDYNSARVMGYPVGKDVTDLNGVSAEFVHVGLGFEEDYAEVDAEGKIVLIERGKLEFVEKARVAKEQGAIAALIYNHEDGPMNFHIPGIALPTLQMNRQDGTALLAEYEAGRKKLDIQVNDIFEVGETVAAFTSRGPVGPVGMDGYIKPDLVAPGVDVSSTIPTHDEQNPHSFAVRHGSSMAAAHVSGAVALLLEAHPSWGQDEVQAALLNTAESVSDARGGVYSRNTQGAGSVRVEEALLSDTLVMPGSHSFGTFVRSTHIEEDRQTLSIYNLADHVQTYDIDVELNGAAKGIEIDVEEDIEVPAGSVYDVEMNVQIDTTLLGSGYYEGTIHVHAEEATIEVPAILFIAEQDDIILDQVHMEQQDFGGFAFDLFLPHGADHVQFFVYAAGEPLQYMSDAGSYTSVQKGWQSYAWPGLQVGHDFDPGSYHVYVYAEQEGKADLRHAGTFEIED